MPVPILAVTVLRGGILIGAFDGDRMVGFVYSLPGIKHGRPTQWSHMLGVLDDYRSAGVGHQLKVLQREQTLAMGLDSIEWTYDPMQALNAHLNFAKLGVSRAGIRGQRLRRIVESRCTKATRRIASWPSGTSRPPESSNGSVDRRRWRRY